MNRARAARPTAEAASASEALWKPMSRRLGSSWDNLGWRGGEGEKEGKRGDLTYASKRLVVGDGDVDRESMRESAGEGAGELVQRGVLAGVEAEVGVHRRAVVGEVVDAVGGRGDDAEVEASASHPPPEVRVAGRGDVE